MINASFQEFKSAAMFAFCQVAKGKRIVRFVKINGLWCVGVSV